MAHIGFVADHITWENGLKLLFNNLKEHYAVEELSFGTVVESPQLFITNTPGIISKLGAPVIYIMTDEAPILSDGEVKNTLTNDIRQASAVFAYSNLAAKEISDYYKIKCRVQKLNVPQFNLSTQDYILGHNIPEAIKAEFPGERFVNYSKLEDFAGAKLYLHQSLHPEYYNIKLCLAAAHGVPSIAQDWGANAEFVSKGDILLHPTANIKKWTQTIRIAMRDRKINARNVREGVKRFSQNSELGDQIRQNVRHSNDNSSLPKHAALLQQEQQERRRREMHETRMELLRRTGRVKRDKQTTIPAAPVYNKADRKKTKGPPARQSIFLTGGIGDVMALESYFSDELRNKLTTIYYATHKQKMIQELFQALPNYPHLKHHIVVWDDFSQFWCFLRKEECIRHIVNTKKQVEPSFYQSVDYGIIPIFPQINSGSIRYNYSSFVSHTLCDVSRFALPLKYVVIAPYSTDKRQGDRDFNDPDWKYTLDYLEEQDILGVVLNVGQEKVPNHPLVTNLANQTSITEAVEILKASNGYIGIDSCLSVLAAKLFSASSILIKSNNMHLMQNKHIYYAPLQDFSFISAPGDKLSQMTVSKKVTTKEVTLNVMQGIGDIFWIYQKVFPYFDLINLNILITAEDAVQCRSVDWVRLLPKVNHVQCKWTTRERYNEIADTRYTIDEVLRLWSDGQKEIEYCCNKWLEEGVTLDDIDPRAVVAREVDIRNEPFALPYEKYIVVYVSGDTKQYMSQKLGAWTTARWVELVDRIYHKYSLELPIVVIGADFDKHVTIELTNELSGHNYKITKFIQLHPAQVVYLLKNAEFFIGYQSGLNVIADNFDVKQLMVYYPYLERMFDTWCQKGHWKDIYYTALFSETPEQVVSRLPPGLFDARNQKSIQM